MALLQKIKEKLGFGSGDAEGDARETEVTVESDPAAEGDAATDDGEGATPAAAGIDDEEREEVTDEPAEDEVDADEPVDEEPVEDDADADEPAEDDADADEPAEDDAD